MSQSRAGWTLVRCAGRVSPHDNGIRYYVSSGKRAACGFLNNIFRLGPFRRHVDLALVERFGILRIVNAVVILFGVAMIVQGAWQASGPDAGMASAAPALLALGAAYLASRRRGPKVARGQTGR